MFCHYKFIFDKIGVPHTWMAFWHNSLYTLRGEGTDSLVVNASTLSVEGPRFQVPAWSCPQFRIVRFYPARRLGLLGHNWTGWRGVSVL